MYLSSVIIPYKKDENNIKLHTSRPKIGGWSVEHRTDKTGKMTQKKTLRKDKVFLDIILKNEQKVCRLLVSENLLTNLHDYIPINF